jgi:hypothetical protein
VDSKRVLWGFALRGYANAAVDLPHIVTQNDDGFAFNY